MDRKVCVAIVDREVIGRQVVPNVARVVARVMMARDRASKASQAKAKIMMAKEKAKVASGKHAKHLMGTAITVGNGDTWKRIVSPNPRARVAKAKKKSAGSLDESEENGPENTSVGGFGLCSFRNHCDDRKWTKCRKVTFTLNSGAAVSAAPKSLGDDYPMQIEEPRSYKTATGSRAQDEGFRVLLFLIEEGLHRCMNFRVAPVHKALVSASKVCRKGYRIILDSELGQSGMLHKHTNEWIVYVFDGWVSPAVTAGRKRSEVVSLTPYEHNVDVAPVDFPRQENHP